MHGFSVPDQRNANDLRLSREPMLGTDLGGLRFARGSPRLVTGLSAILPFLVEPYNALCPIRPLRSSSVSYFELWFSFLYRQTFPKEDPPEWHRPTTLFRTKRGHGLLWTRGEQGLVGVYSTTAPAEFYSMISIDLLLLIFASTLVARSAESRG